MYKNDVILDIRDDFTETLEYCDPIALAFLPEEKYCGTCHSERTESFCTAIIKTL